MVGGEMARSWLHVLLDGRQIYNTWKKQLGRGLRRLQSGEINSRNETGKAQGRSELCAGVQRLQQVAVGCPRQQMARRFRTPPASLTVL